MCKYYSTIISKFNGVFSYLNQEHKINHVLKIKYKSYNGYNLDILCLYKFLGFGNHLESNNIHSIF